MVLDPWPVDFAAALEARERLRPYLAPTPTLVHPLLDEAVGAGIRVFVKHENHQPTGAFKVRNGLNAMLTLTAEERACGVVAATRGNHGLGLAYAGRRLGIPVTVCVPLGNNPEKNAALRAYGASLIEIGRDYDECALEADRLVRERGLRLVHSTNDPAVIAGAATLTLELLEQVRELDALVLSVGGGSQAVGALVVVRALRPALKVYAVQAAGASATHDSWHAGRPLHHERAATFADGLATRSAYPTTFEALRAGLSGFVAVSEGELAEAVRAFLWATHNLAEGAGAASLAGLMQLRDELRDRRVGIVLSGGNIDQLTLRRVLMREL